MSAQRVGFIGLGNMGGRIARRLTDAGVEVHGFDLDEDAVARAGASAAARVADVADSSTLIFLSLPDSRVVEGVVHGADGLLAQARAGQIIVDLSTAAPASTRVIAEAFSGRGASFLDAGVSGGAAAAEAGTLTLMVGGDGAALDLARGVIDLFASRVFFLGPSGAGHTTKLLNNFLNAVALSATAEVMIAARSADLDLAAVLDVFNASSGINFATLNRFPKIITGDYLEGGLSNTLMLKDVTLYVELLAQLQVASLNASGPMASFGVARALGYADAISNRVVDALGDLSGGVRVASIPEGER